MTRYFKCEACRKPVNKTYDDAGACVGYTCYACGHTTEPPGRYQMGMKPKPKPPVNIEPALRTIMDTMTGADGGEAYVLLRVLLSTLTQRANDGDDDARKILTIVEQFARLIDIAKQHHEADV